MNQNAMSSSQADLISVKKISRQGNYLTRQFRPGAKWRCKERLQRHPIGIEPISEGQDYQDYSPPPPKSPPPKAPSTSPPKHPRAEEQDKGREEGYLVAGGTSVVDQQSQGRRSVFLQPLHHLRPEKKTIKNVRSGSSLLWKNGRRWREIWGGG